MPQENRISHTGLADWQAAATAFFAAGLSLLIYGWSYANDPNTAQIIPFIKKIADPALYPNDFFIGSLPAFPSLYPLCMAKLAAFCPLETLHWMLYLPIKFIFMRLVYELALELFERRDTAVIACVLTAASPLANVFTLLGEDPLLKTAMFQTSVTGPMALLGILLLLRGRNYAASITLWIMFFINGLLAVFTASIYFAVFLFSPERRKELFKAMILFMALMLPWALWYAGHKNPYAPASPDFVKLLRLWYPGHYFPLSWSPEKWRGIIIFMPLFAYFYISGLAHCRHEKEIKIFICTLAALWAAGFIFAELLPVRQIIVLQLLRSDSLFIGIGIVLAAATVVRLAETDTRHTALAGLLCCALFELAGPYNSPYALYSLYIVILFFVDRFMPKIAPIIAATTAIYAVVMGFRFPVQWPQAAVVFLFSMLYIMNRNVQLSLSRKELAICAFAVLPFAPLPVEHLQHGFEYRNTEVNDWLHIQDWAKANSTAGTVFLTPPDQFGFRVFSERSPVVEWLDASAMHWAPGAEKIWMGRLRDIAAVHDATSGHMPAFMQNDIGYAEITSDGYLALCRKYGAKYFITRSDHDMSPLHPAYANGTFAIYAAN
jgi:hypothetical protein